ncbi:MAG TPA: helicase-related protein [Kofleriaceae bacterium]
MDPALANLANPYRPGTARAVDGSATGAMRAATLADFRAGAFQVLVNCALFTEGFDEPSIACVAIARPTKSRALFAQMVGRGIRLAPGKADVLVLDFTAIAGRHRLVGPADVLAGAEVTDDMRRELEARLTGAAADLDGLIVATKHAAITAVAHYRAEELDPFLGELPAVSRAPWSGDLATDRQREALARAGLDDPPNTLTKGEAARWLDAIAARRASGLATLRQARFLHRHGIDGRRMTFGAATDAIDRLKAGWHHARDTAVLAAPDEIGAVP